MKGIHIRVSENIISQLKEIKGDGPWIELLLDGAKYRGHELSIQRTIFNHYETHHYCPHCQKWHLHEDCIYGVARARVRCPDCFKRVRTRSPVSLLKETPK